MSVHRIVYVVGAGLSAGLGFPTIHDLLPKLWPRLISTGLDADLAKVIRFHHPEFNADRTDTFPDIETLLSEMDANIHLFNSSRPLTGNFTRDDLLNIQQDMLLEMGAWFHAINSQKKPKWLTILVEKMREEQACIVSFNYDLVLDSLIFGAELSKESYGFGIQDSGVCLLKPHGSLNWFHEKRNRHIKDEKRFELAGSGEDSIFVFKPFREPKSKHDRKYMPLIVPPVYSKRFEGPVFESLWQRTVSAISTATEVRFLGYSLPRADFHARFILRCGFYNQEHGELIEGGRAAPSGRSAVTIVDKGVEGPKRIRDAVGIPCRTRKMTIEDWVLTGGLG